MAKSVRAFVAEDLWLLIVIVTVGIVSLSGVAGLDWLAGGLSVIGFIVLLPVFLFWGEEIAEWAFGEEDDETESEVDPLSTLKREYAEGAIDDATFERRVDRLLETDRAVADASAPSRSHDTAQQEATDEERARDR